MSDRALGSLIGALIITFLTSRILHKCAFKTQTPTKKALSVGLGTITLSVVLPVIASSFTDRPMSPIEAFLIYAPGVVVWLIVDLVRAQRSGR